MNDNYTSLKTRHGPAFVKKTQAMAEIDAIVFDCDGVLIDTRDSYERTILTTLDRLIGEMFGVKFAWRARIRRLIQALRSTGGFNNDWDATYALSLFAACSLPSDYRGDLGQPSDQRGSRKLGNRVSSLVITRMTRLVNEYSALPNHLGHETVDRFVQDSFSTEDRVICEFVRSYEGYPGTPPSSRLATLFDEMYHGPKLYEEMYGAEPKYYAGRGYIEDDRPLVREADLRFLSEMMRGRLALATGRPRQAAEYSLGRLMAYFQPEASVFIGDADRGPYAQAKLDAFRKPSGLSLIHARDKLNSEELLYVGDSAEDLQMVRNVRKSLNGISFAGVYGTANDPQKQREFFIRNGAELVLPAVAELPSLLRRAWI